MRIVLVAPSRSDPAHRRVLSALTRELSAAGDEVLSFTSRRGLARLLRERRADVCHVQFFSRGLGHLRAADIPRRTKLVLTHQGASLELMERRDVFRALAGRADSVTCVSRHGLRQLRGLLPSSLRKSSWIPNGADLDGAAPRAAANARRPFILTVGRLAAYKGIDLLLMAFAGLAKERRDIRLAVCGPDQTRGRLRRFARKLDVDGRVDFLGDVPAEDVRRLMEGCLFFVLPSREENMPMALLEALAAGKAAVAADVGGVAELLRPGAGLLVPANDVPRLAAAMRRLLRDEPLRRRLGGRARRRARLFSWAAVAARYRRLYVRTDGLPGDSA